MNDDTTTNTDDNYEWMTIAEIRSAFASVRTAMDVFPAALNIYVYPRCKRFANGHVHLTVRYEGYPEHVEHAHCTGVNNTRAYEDELDSTAHIDKVLPFVQFEHVDDRLAQAMAEAITRCPLPLVEGYRLRNHYTGETGEFYEWALSDEMQIVVRIDGQQRLKTWNLEDVLIDAPATPTPPGSDESESE